MEILRNSCKQEEPKETWQVTVILFPGSDPGTGKEKNLGFFPLGWKLGNLNKVWSYVIDYVCAQSLSYVWLFATPWTVTYQASLPISNFQARVLDWGAISYSRGSSWPRDWTPKSPALAGRFFTTEPLAPQVFCIYNLNNSYRKVDDEQWWQVTVACRRANVGGVNMYFIQSRLDRFIGLNIKWLLWWLRW